MQSPFQTETPLVLKTFIKVGRSVYVFDFLLFGLFVADEWVKFDDDKVSVVSPDDILKLSGGGDWHIAYVLLYGPRRLEVLEEEQ